MFILTMVGLALFVFLGIWFNDLMGYEREKVYRIVWYTLLSVVFIAFGVFVFIVS